jgi:hypothetical protein
MKAREQLLRARVSHATPALLVSAVMMVTHSNTDKRASITKVSPIYRLFERDALDVIRKSATPRLLFVGCGLARSEGKSGCSGFRFCAFFGHQHAQRNQQDIIFQVCGVWGTWVLLCPKVKQQVEEGVLVSTLSHIKQQQWPSPCLSPLSTTLCSSTPVPSTPTCRSSWAY